VQDERDVPAGADVLVEVTQQRQEGLVDVLAAFAEAVVFQPPDGDAIRLVHLTCVL